MKSAPGWIARTYALAPIALGIMAFFLVVGPRALNPTNIAWLGNGDLATHYLGWIFFSQSGWFFPLGLNPDYGLEFSNAILFSDSNPLLAFLFKPFVSLLPQPFQYFGIWLLACFVLQAWFAWKLIGLVSTNVAVRILGAGLFVFAPPMIFRMGGHPNLAGHFLIVAALYFTFHPKLNRRTLIWSLLISVAALVHAYLMVMVASMWFASVADQLISKRISNRNAATEFVIVFAAVGLVCWQAGYFVVGSGANGGSFGYYRMNLLSILDASHVSYTLKDIPEAPGDYEGFNFLGMGVIFLAICALPTLLAGQHRLDRALRCHPILLFVLAGLAIFALSNKVGVGAFGFEYPLPEKVISFASYFRASGRMFWPVFYTIVFTIIFIVVRSNNRRTVILLLGLALIIQIVDTHAGWRNIRGPLMVEAKSTWDTPMQSPFWKEAAIKYKKVRWIQPAGHSAKWMHLAAFAGGNKMATDAVYLARVGNRVSAQARENAAKALKTGRYERDALYVFDDNAFRLASLSIDVSSDLIAKIDGFNVVAPGWKKCAECAFHGNDVQIGELFPPVTLGKKILFGESGDGLPYLLTGWSVPESSRTWSDGDIAEIVMPLPSKAHTILIEANAFVAVSHPLQEVVISVNDTVLLTVRLRGEGLNLIELPLPEEVRKKAIHNLLRLSVRLPNAVRPVDIGINGDNRKLALALQSITLH
jgi:uncharacterized membrane protein YjjB (DUF3815 family)